MRLHYKMILLFRVCVIGLGDKNFDLLFVGSVHGLHNTRDLFA
jgi:hypothetical protein